jgi:hypothetical protein
VAAVAEWPIVSPVPRAAAMISVESIRPTTIRRRLGPAAGDVADPELEDDGPPPGHPRHREQAERKEGQQRHMMLLAETPKISFTGMLPAARPPLRHRAARARA